MPLVETGTIRTQIGQHGSRGRDAVYGLYGRLGRVDWGLPVSCQKPLIAAVAWLFLLRTCSISRNHLVVLESIFAAIPRCTGPDPGGRKFRGRADDRWFSESIPAVLQGILPAHDSHPEHGPASSPYHHFCYRTGSDIGTFALGLP